MIITEKDIGRKVVDGFGYIETIVAFNPGDKYPVKTNIYNYTTTGEWLTGCGSLVDLVKFVDKEMNDEKK